VREYLHRRDDLPRRRELEDFPTRDHLRWPPEEKRHSRVGVVSFALAAFAGLLVFALVAVAGYLEATTPGGMDENDPVVMTCGVVVLGAGALQLVALALGIASLAETNRKKVFAVLGVVFSGLTLFGTVALVVLGLLLG
jgi:hypothetical protein